MLRLIEVYEKEGLDYARRYVEGVLKISEFTT